MKKILVFGAIVLLCIITVVLPAVAQQTPSGISYTKLSERIDQHVSQHIGRTSPGLAVVVISDGDIIFSRGYGYADVAAGLPVKPDETVFEYGSVSKLFVYTTLMQLVEAGKLDLAADVRSYLPDGFLRHLRYDDPIRLLDIMNHRAGFEDILLDVVVTHPKRQTDFEALLSSRQPRQVYRPGTITAYSNYAVALAAYIAENKLAQPLYSYLQATVFQPLSMQKTTAHPLMLDRSDLKTHRARGYVYDAGSDRFHETGWSYIPMYPVGAVQGTAEDLARFAMALMPPASESGPMFIHRYTLDNLFSQSAGMGPGMTGFAHGFIEHDGAYRGVGHGGNTAGFSAQLNFVPELRFGVVVLANAAGEIDLTEGLTRLLLGSDAETTPLAGTNLPDPARLAGSYLSARRPYSGFLKLYGFLSLLEVEATGPDSIKVSFVGQSADYVQTEPNLFAQTSAEGAFFQYSFKQMYFEAIDGDGYRISGDFLPLPAGHTKPWLIGDALLLGLSSLFFILVPVLLGLIWLVKRLKRVQVTTAGVSQSVVQSNQGRWLVPLLLASGLFLLLNNGILVLRMLMDNYRSYTEVQLQLILNYPFALLGLVASTGCVVAWRKRSLSTARRSLCAAAMLLLAVLFYLLIKWQFLA